MVTDRLQRALPYQKVITSKAFSKGIVHYLLTATALGISFGTSTAFGLIIGLVIVSLSMFSAVIDNMKDFGALKALGATTLDLARLLFVQAIIYAFSGTLIGLFLVTRMAGESAGANLALNLSKLYVLGHRDPDDRAMLSGQPPGTHPFAQRGTSHGVQMPQRSKSTTFTKSSARERWLLRPSRAWTCASNPANSL